MKKTGLDLSMVDIDDFDVSLKEINEYVNYINHKLGLLLEKKQEITERITKLKRSLIDISHFIGLDLRISSLVSTLRSASVSCLRRASRS